MIALLLILSTVLPPIGQWVSCDDPRYSIGGHGLCDYPQAPPGPPPEPVNITYPVDIVIHLSNGTYADLLAYENGTVVLK